MAPDKGSGGKGTGWRSVYDEAARMLRRGMTPYAVAKALYKKAGISLNTAVRRAQLQVAEIEAWADADQSREDLAACHRERAALRTVIAGLLNDQRDPDTEGGQG